MMFILRRTLLQQLTCKNDIVKSVFRIQCKQMHNSSGGLSALDVPKNPITSQITSDRFTLVEHCTKRCFSNTPAPNSAFNKIVGYFQSSKAVLEGKSTLIYGQSVDTLNHVDFVLKFGMPNTFNSWFLVTEIHVWMLMVRAMAEREHHEVIRNGIVAALWRDSFERARQLGEHGRIIKTQLNELSQQFQYAIVAYDEGLMTNDKQLASAIWRRFFDSNCDNYELIELMVKYIRLNVSNLDQLNSEDFLTKRKFVWPSLADVEKGKY